MVPFLPRMHLFEIDDQPWFHPFLRTRVQDALTLVWNTRVPILLPLSAAEICATLLLREFTPSTLASSVCIDFCAGAGGPTPGIAKHLNARTSTRVPFVLTDLHPNISAWERLARRRPEVSFERESVDASDAPRRLVKREDGRDVIRLFNLAFHHFDDPLASKILKNTVETSQGFAIFEMQDRSPSSFLATCLLPIAVVLLAPYFSWKWRSPMTLFFSWVVPIIPFVLWFDGWISGLRTRTPAEVEALLRGCGADTSEWEMKSGSEVFLPPLGHMNWIICKPVKKK
ncbi:hypothetical protein LIA77_01974 [Sarocladium implicatum]|nr:hypothetical protein LIA77_01974 [Sarocladium implicatum]